MDDKHRGLYDKYTVTHNYNQIKHRSCEFFVLDLKHDKFSIPALQAYIEACKGEFPELARDLAIKVQGMKEKMNVD